MPDKLESQFSPNEFIPNDVSPEFAAEADRAFNQFCVRYGQSYNWTLEVMKDGDGWTATITDRHGGKSTHPIAAADGANAIPWLLEKHYKEWAKRMNPAGE